MRRELDLLQKQRGVAAEQAPSGLKLHIPEPIRIIGEDSAAVSAAPAPASKR
ncbi:MAG TPA: hypothetical protein VIM09_08915 [Chthoniobacterales bacterium]